MLEPGMAKERFVVLQSVKMYHVKFAGLPHGHLILTFGPDDKLDSVGKIDRILRAQIPDKVSECATTRCK